MHIGLTFTSTSICNASLERFLQSQEVATKSMSPGATLNQQLSGIGELQLPGYHGWEYSSISLILAFRVSPVGLNSYFPNADIYPQSSKLSFLGSPPFFFSWWFGV
jgi:hypothetical protein